MKFKKNQSSNKWVVKKQVSGQKFRNDVILINMSAQLMQSIKKYR